MFYIRACFYCNTEIAKNLMFYNSINATFWASVCLFVGFEAISGKLFLVVSLGTVLSSSQYSIYKNRTYL